MTAVPVLDPMVAGIGALMVAGGNIVAAIVGKSVGRGPPIPEVALANRLAHIVAVLAAIGVWYLSASMIDRPGLAATAMGLLCATVAAVVGYILALASWTIRCPDDPQLYLGGIWGTKTAKDRLRMGREQEGSGPTDIQDYFCNSGRNAGLIWSWRSRTWARAMLALLYAVMIFTATGALTAGWILLMDKVVAHPTEAAPPARGGPVAKSVVIPSDLLFDYGKAELSPAASATLKTVADQLRSQSISQLTISGHTDSRGSARFNQRLSERRASAVYAWLTSAGCLGPEGVFARGYGASQPVAPNVRADGSDYPEGRARNRRVEIHYVLAADGERPSAPAKACPPG